MDWLQVMFWLLLGVVGACLGSFLCCQARRLRLRELATHPHQRRQRGARNQPPAPVKTARQGKSSAAQTSRNGAVQSQVSAAALGARSVCLSCGQQLKWYDNIPLLSWLMLGGRCRYCHAKIGALEPLSELGMALAFVLCGVAFVTVQLPVGEFIGLLIFSCLIGFLAIYDGAYGELPTPILTISVIYAIIMATLKIWAGFLATGWTPELILAPLGAAAILGGLYLLLYLVSRGKWVGDGDWLLGVALGLMLGSPWLALVALCLANLLAFFVSLPLMWRKQMKKSAIPLGPFLVAAFLVVAASQEFLLQLLQI